VTGVQTCALPISIVPLKTCLLDYSWVVGIAKTQRITGPILSAVHRKRMSLHPLLGVNLIPPIGIRIGYIIWIAGRRYPVRVFFGCLPGIDNALSKGWILT